MGAANFHTCVPKVRKVHTADGVIAEPRTMAEAFSDAVSDARYEHGHGGYTGTIAEKGGYRLGGQLPTDDAAYALDAVLSGWGYDLPAEPNEWQAKAKANADAAVALYGVGKLAGWAQTYNDKFGPCVAFETPDSYHFCGMASC